VKRLFASLLIAVSTPAMAASGHAELAHASVDATDPNTLQRGARVFVNYCLSCHAASYMRFSRAAEDMQLPEQVLKQNLLFVADKPTATMDVSMRKDDAAKWFGVVPPDLSVIARAKGADYLYTYLTSYYVDPKRPTGVNNLAYPNTAMPHVMWDLQGLQRMVEEDGNHTLEVTRAGTLSKAEYERLVNDLVSFMVYMSEPGKQERHSLGFWVLAFLAFFTWMAWQLKKEFWRDVH
jgi:ubiquinol-cytochrome c reductase cytochrome c1 subunit